MDTEAARSSLTPERPQRSDWTPGVRLDSPYGSSNDPTPEFDTPFHLYPAPGTPKFPQLYRDPDERENLTPHIERAKAAPKQVRLGSEHFTNDYKNEEMWQLISRGNFDTVTMPVDEGRKLWEMAKVAGASSPQASRSTLATAPRAGSSSVRRLSPVGSLPRTSSPVVQVRPPRVVTSARSSITPRRPPGLTAYPLRDGMYSVPMPMHSARVWPEVAAVRSRSPPHPTRMTSQVVRQVSPIRAQSPGPMVHDSGFVPRATSPVTRMCSATLTPTIPPPLATPTMPPPLATSASAMLSPVSTPAVHMAPAPNVQPFSRPVWLGRGGWIGSHRQRVA